MQQRNFFSKNNTSIADMWKYMKAAKRYGTTPEYERFRDLHQKLNSKLMEKKIGYNVMSKREYEVFCRKEMHYSQEDTEILMSPEFENFDENAKNRAKRIIDNDKYTMFTPRILKDRLLGCGFEPYEIEETFHEEFLQSVFLENAELIAKVIVNNTLSKEENTLRIRLELSKEEFPDYDIQHILEQTDILKEEKKEKKK